MQDEPTPGKNPNRRRKDLDAITPFITSHELLFGIPSGEITRDIRVSDEAADWSYTARQSTRSTKGPPTPLEILGRDTLPQHRNIVTLTDLHVTACIGWHHAEEYPSAEWENPVMRAAQKMIVLGATGIAAPDPASAQWRLSVVMKGPSKKTEYAGVFATKHCIALGAHAILSNSPDDTTALVEHIRLKSVSRLQGGPPSPSEWAENINFHDFPTRAQIRIKKYDHNTIPPLT